MKQFIFNAAMVVCIMLKFDLYAQNELIDTAAFSKIRNAELSNLQLPVIAHYLTDVSGPRLINSPGYTRAATASPAAPHPTPG